MEDSAAQTGKSVLGKISFETGKLCRVATRQVKLTSIRRQRKHYFQNLGERLYIFKMLQKEENVWDKEEISQLLLTLSDLDQEQELLIQEINEIKAEMMPGEPEVVVGEPEVSEPTVEKAAASPVEPVSDPTGQEKKASKRKPAAKPKAKPAAAGKTAKSGTPKTAAKKVAPEAETGESKPATEN
ncbi:MAG: hypothetical protein JXO49_10390 [Deltaproteobacteria bacterium]|nr:hypothetical protein [Candidatus Anaeroferrophillus wilburensis]MBN2889739.1 hypothetical protein [Deltaproteobacteria bacterium]